MPCAIGKRLCTTLTHPHHVRLGAHAGMGQKPDDAATVPLCARHHDEAHTLGAVSFGVKYRIDLAALAARLAARSPYLSR